MRELDRTRDADDAPDEVDPLDGAVAMPLPDTMPTTASCAGVLAPAAMQGERAQSERAPTGPAKTLPGCSSSTEPTVLLPLV